MKLGVWVLAGAALILAAIVAVRAGRPAGAKSGSAAPSEPSSLDPAKWVRTLEGDFEEKLVDSFGDDRLRIRAATRGTRDETVKFLGARSVSKFALRPEARVSARLDWNRQANGSYLSAAIILSPQAVTGNPLTGSDWFKVEYIGVPPGENARLLVACRTGGRERFLQTEGWPDTNRKGRKIGLQEIEIVVSGGSVKVLENGTVAFETTERVIGFDAAHLYLQLSTHSNYPPREIFFDRIRVPGEK